MVFRLSSLVQQYGSHRLWFSTTHYGDATTAAAVAAPWWFGYGAAVLRGDVVHLLWS